MRSEIVLLYSLLWLMSCSGESASKVQSDFYSNDPIGEQDTVWVDPQSSQIIWKGTKMRGLGKHEGVIALKRGYLLMTNDVPAGGEFIIDMRSMEVTDIPEHEPIPRKNLINHLKGPDFFAVDQYPEAQLKLTSVVSPLKIQGLLDMHGISNSITFEAFKNDQGFQTVIILDRFRWNIAYEGSWIDRTLVDREIELNINLVLK
ncbi:YceI family protein [Ekhidna sp.]|uniref:YceI family protein n=1 Tax=Ekhidna sp. TaxID=2608089 RepID=UPI0035111E37